MSRIKRNIILIFGIVCSLLCSSCFDMIEQIHVNTDGSGSIKSTFNFSENATSAGLLMKFKSFHSINIPSKEEIKSNVEKTVLILKRTPGITQVQYRLDLEKLILEISCQFNQVATLNDFTDAVSTQFKVPISKFTSYQYDSKNKIYTRNYSYSTEAATYFNKLKEKYSDQLKTASITSITRFNSPILSQSNKLAHISGNQRNVQLKIPFMQLLDNKATLSNTIKLTNTP